MTARIVNADQFGGRPRWRPGRASDSQLGDLVGAEWVGSGAKQLAGIHVEETSAGPVRCGSRPRFRRGSPRDRPARGVTRPQRESRSVRPLGAEAHRGTSLRADGHPPPDPMRASTTAPRHASSVVAFLNQPAATATATAASLVGIALSLAPFIGSSTALALVGIPMLLWGTFQVTFK